MYKMKIYFAAAGTNMIVKGEKGFDKPSKSDFGHVWYVLENGKTGEVYSYGWSTGSDKGEGGENNIVRDDNRAYFGKEDKPITEISVDISEHQYIGLQNFPRKALSEAIPNFKPNYNVFTNNCIHFVTMDLADNALVRKDFREITVAFPLCTSTSGGKFLLDCLTSSGQIE